MMPLSLANPNEEYIIRKVSGSKEIRLHLENLGFTVGSDVSLVSSLNGNIIVSIKGSRVAIGKDLATKIMV